MDQGQQEREINKQDFALYISTEKDLLNPELATYQILRSLGFRIIFEEEEVKDFSGYSATYVNVIINRKDISKIKAVIRQWDDSPENALFHRTVRQPNIVILRNLLAGQFDPRLIPPPWIRENQPLIRRSVKAGWLKGMEISMEWSPKDVEMLRQWAEAIEEPALDPEGLRIVIRQKMEEILEQHPKLRPDYRETP